LTDLVNTLLGCAPSDDSNLADGQASAQVAIGVGLDGWHHSREALAQFPDPVLAAARRVHLLVVPRHSRSPEALCDTSFLPFFLG
jgi:hypothetical protein